MELIKGDIVVQDSIDEVIRTAQLDEIYNFTLPSFIPASLENPVMTAEVSALSVLYILETIRKFKSDAKFHKTSSSEMFGNAQETPQNEKTPFCPRNPYGVAKVYGHWITVDYRRRYKMFACSDIFYNHKSAKRKKAPLNNNSDLRQE